MLYSPSYAFALFSFSVISQGTRAAPQGFERHNMEEKNTCNLCYRTEQTKKRVAIYMFPVTTLFHLCCILLVHLNDGDARHAVAIGKSANANGPITKVPLEKISLEDKILCIQILLDTPRNSVCHGNSSVQPLIVCISSQYWIPLLFLSWKASTILLGFCVYEYQLLLFCYHGQDYV